MNTKVVRNKSEYDLAIPDVGVVKAGETIKVSVDFSNANFEEVKSAKEETKGSVDEKPKKIISK